MASEAPLHKKAVVHVCFSYVSSHFNI